MLQSLRIRDLGVISDASLQFGPGLSVVTGETGTGKTMVVSGLHLLFGGRADVSRVRLGADQAVIEGSLDVSLHPAAGARVIDAGGEIDDGELLLRRTVTSGGRSRATAGGTTTPVGVLAAVGEELFAIHGQSDQMRLARPGEQRRALDRYAGIDLAEYRVAFEDWQQAQRRLDERTRDTGALIREADLLQHGVAEIDAVAPIRGEDQLLAAQAARLSAADELRLAARTAHDALLGDADDPASDSADAATLISLAARQLAAVSGADAELDALASRVSDLSAAVTDLGAEFGAYADSLDADPEKLATTHSRRAVLSALVRKFGQVGPAGEPADVGSVLDWADAARSRLAEVDTSEEALGQLTAARDHALGRVTAAATELRQARLAAATALGAAVTAELAGLAMAEATLTIDVHGRVPVTGAPVLTIAGRPAQAGGEGADEVEFLLRPHPDSPATPIQKGASGGELSRVMLALEVVLAGTDPVPLMVFDEVDAGVGGRAAVEIGRRLARLARRHQVIVVTHLAQVAAFADHHLVVGELTSDGSSADPAADSGTASQVSLVDGDARIGELARMLAGRDTVTAREHAAELLADARAEDHTDDHTETTRPARRPGSGPGGRPGSGPGPSPARGQGGGSGRAGSGSARARDAPTCARPAEREQRHIRAVELAGPRDSG